MKKRYILAIAAMMLFGTVSAQENQNNKTQFLMDFGFGSTIFASHSDVSIFQDPTNTYLSKICISLNLGMGKNDAFFGVFLDGDVVTTSAYSVNEDMGLFKFGLMLRDYEPLKNNLQAVLGFKLGPTVSLNDILYNVQDEQKYKEFIRWGFCLEPEIGLNYRTSGGGNIGISIEPFIVLNFKNNIVLPEDLDTDLILNDKGQFEEDNINWYGQTCGGIRLTFHLGGLL